MEPLSMKWRSGRPVTSLLQWQISQNWLPGPDLALLPPSNRVYSTSMCLCSPILLSSLQHLIWNPNGAFEHEVKEWKAITSLLQCQISLNWLPGPDLALLPPSNHVYSTSMCLCSPILLSSLQHLIWNPNGAFEHEVKEWKACYLPFTMSNISKLTTWARFGTFATFELRLLHRPRVNIKKLTVATGMCLCSPILLSSLQHLIWNPNGAFEHEVKEWKAITSLLQWQISQNWLPGPDLALLPPSNRVYSPACVCAPQFF